MFLGQKKTTFLQKKKKIGTKNYFFCFDVKKILSLTNNPSNSQANNSFNHIFIYTENKKKKKKKKCIK